MFRPFPFKLLEGKRLTVDNPTRQLFIVELVERESLINTVGLNSLISNISRMIGPAIAAGLSSWRLKRS